MVASQPAENVPSILGRFERFAIVEAIGFSRFGAIYRAKDPKTAAVAAILVLAPDYTSQPSIIARFLKSARVAQKLEHRNIASYRELINSPTASPPLFGLVWAPLMGTLEQRLEAGPLRVEEAAAIILQVADALTEIHRQGVLHGDLSPASIFVGDEVMRERVRLCGAGLAGRLDKPYKPTLIDDPERDECRSFLAPEQKAGEALGMGVDLYACGALILAMLGQSRPREFAKLGQVLVGGGSLTQALVAIAGRCLGDSPAERLATAAELRELLGEAIATCSAAETEVDASPESLERSAEFSAPSTEALASASFGSPAQPDPERLIEGDAPLRGDDTLVEQPLMDLAEDAEERAPDGPEAGSTLAAHATEVATAGPAELADATAAGSSDAASPEHENEPEGETVEFVPQASETPEASTGGDDTAVVAAPMPTSEASAKPVSAVRVAVLVVFFLAAIFGIAWLGTRGVEHAAESQIDSSEVEPPEEVQEAAEASEGKVKKARRPRKRRRTRKARRKRSGKSRRTPKKQDLSEKTLDPFSR